MSNVRYGLILLFAAGCTVDLSDETIDKINQPGKDHAALEVTVWEKEYAERQKNKEFREQTVQSLNALPTIMGQQQEKFLREFGGGSAPAAPAENPAPAALVAPVLPTQEAAYRQQEKENEAKAAALKALAMVNKAETEVLRAEKERDDAHRDKLGFGEAMRRVDQLQRDQEELRREQSRLKEHVQQTSLVNAKFRHQFRQQNAELLEVGRTTNRELQGLQSSVTGSFRDLSQSVDRLPVRIGEQLSVRMTEWAAAIEREYNVTVIVDVPPAEIVNKVEVRQEFVPHLNCPVRVWGPCPTPSGPPVLYAQPCP
ncbi:MAG: hypothetical protein WD200_01795 [Candidatus Andersenbacteria bacterium]